MNKNTINSKFRDYIANHLSPTESERHFITKVYDSFLTLLTGNCLQIGSYPRFTAIRPLHDLDIIYVCGIWERNNSDPHALLEDLKEKIIREYKNPTRYTLDISLQTHSISIIYKDGLADVFSVDIVPGYKYSLNEFKQDTYFVPELVYLHHGFQRTDFYKKLSVENQPMAWVLSDPRGYIEVAKLINQRNTDFRKTVKLVKAWKNSCKEKDIDFKLKSFHLEQIITEYFRTNKGADIFDVIFTFFVELPDYISQPRIKDRADNLKYIDDYVANLSVLQKQNIIKARDCFLIKLEELGEKDTVDQLFEPCFYTRASADERFLFDYKIPTLIEESYFFDIEGEVQEKDGFRRSILTKSGNIQIGRKIKFRVIGRNPNIDFYKWKVKNDNSSPQPRGEITDKRTRNDLETTLYIGDHYVECFAIKNNVCVAKAKQYVRITNPY